MEATLRETRLGDWVDDLAKQAGLTDIVKQAQSAADTVTQIGKQAQSIADNPFRAAIKSIEIRTAWSAPITMSADAIWAAATAPSDPHSLFKSLAARIKPTIVFDTPFGKRTVAPFGEASPTEWKGNVMMLLGLGLGGLALYTAGGYYLGWKAGQRKAAREMGVPMVSMRKAAVALKVPKVKVSKRAVGAFAGVGFGR